MAHFQCAMWANMVNASDSARSRKWSVARLAMRRKSIAARTRARRSRGEAEQPGGEQRREAEKRGKARLGGKARWRGEKGSRGVEMLTGAARPIQEERRPDGCQANRHSAYRVTKDGNSARLSEM